MRAYANLGNELPEAGYSPDQIEQLKAEVEHYEKVRTEVKLASGDYVDMKVYEPAMRHLLEICRAPAVRCQDWRRHARALP